MLSANDIKMFIVLCKSPLELCKIAVCRFLTSLLVPELTMFKNLRHVDFSPPNSYYFIPREDS